MKKISKKISIKNNSLYNTITQNSICHKFEAWPQTTKKKGGEKNEIERNKKEITF